MPWKLITLQSVIVIALSYLAIQYFSLNQLSEVQFLQEDLAAEITLLKEEVQTLDQKVLRLQQDTQNNGIPEPDAADYSEAQSALDRGFMERLDGIEEHERALQQMVDSLVNEQEKLVQLQRQSVPEYVKVKNWMDSLPLEKKSQVQEVYRQQSEEMMENISMEPDAPPPNPEEMLDLLRKNREDLKTKLKELLSKQEYQAFLESLDTGTVSPGLPPLSQ
jgi:hypothetical protein